MLLFFSWIILSFIVGAFAKSKGHSFAAATVLSLLLSPLIGGLFTAVRSADAAELEKRALESGAQRKCPACAELVQRDAIKCKHCGTDLPALAPPAQE